ncbi:MAG: Planctomycete cytochrome, partial [Phycisphaerales bacterium]|nr:Planctomycete cytochrome [Phycisphaerales bacterium]
MQQPRHQPNVRSAGSVLTGGHALARGSGDGVGRARWLRPGLGTALFAAAAAAMPTTVLAAPRLAGPPDYNRDVRPILAENCFYCHGQDPNHRKADLRLDVRESALKLKAIVPGDAKASGLVERVLTDDADEQMPPPNSHRTLSPTQKDILKRWVAGGAEYQPHWTFVAPVRPPLPDVKRAGWARNPIDRFVLAKLEAEGLAPSPEADRATLIRRVTLDLTGLPPAPADVDAFVADDSPSAYDRLVNRLLASPTYGERMALPWLDAARYADSNGFQQDGDTYQWIWRDWVVKSLNADVPFDTFSIEQLAGDLLPKPTAEQKIATAFNRNHLLNGEGGAIAEEQRFNVLFDRVDTTATTWLGLTVACAQCHDHKFDPITQRDYYSLMAAFNALPETGVPNLGGGSRIRVATPVLELPTDENNREVARLEAELKAAETAGDTKKKFEVELAKWEPTVTPDSVPGFDRNVFQALRTPEAERTADEKKRVKAALRAYFEKTVYPGISAKDSNVRKADALKKQIAKYKNEEIARVMVMEDSKPRETFVLDRGKYETPTKVKVDPAPPAFLPPLPPDAPKNRLGIARWLFDPANPLTARVQVNRFWQTYFGTGLVKTSEDLGIQSEAPVHRDLLDWLAVEFREPTVGSGKGDAGNVDEGGDGGATAEGLAPSPGIPGEGRGEGSPGDGLVSQPTSIAR